ncbi:TPA: hypothetical protein NNP44_004568 [Salmonella enterica]|nr:hypothetical protein [Salmonella enterica]HCH8780923.1 hypothetical protein [Salmonella enterica]
MKGIKVFKADDEFELTRVMNDWMERAGVEPISVSGFADRHNYLITTVIYQSTEQNVGDTIPKQKPETEAEGVVNARRFIGSSTCQKCGGNMQVGWENNYCPRCSPLSR